MKHGMWTEHKKKYKLSHFSFCQEVIRGSSSTSNLKITGENNSSFSLLHIFVISSRWCEPHLCGTSLVWVYIWDMATLYCEIDKNHLTWLYFFSFSRFHLRRYIYCTLSFISLKCKMHEECQRKFAVLK